MSKTDRELIAELRVVLTRQRYSPVVAGNYCAYAREFVDCLARRGIEISNRGAGGAVFAPRHRAVPETPWSTSGAVLALDPALRNPRAVAACAGPGATRPESYMRRRRGAVHGLRRIRDLASRGAWPCPAQHRRALVGGTALPGLAARGYGLRSDKSRAFAPANAAIEAAQMSGLNSTIKHPIAATPQGRTGGTSHTSRQWPERLCILANCKKLLRFQRSPTG